MEIRQLRYIAVLAEELNFTRAAARLHISQPPLSLQIAQLERELDVRLFDRNNRRVTLTEAGEAFLNDVRALLASLKDATVRVRAVDRGVRLGAQHRDAGPRAHRPDAGDGAGRGDSRPDDDVVVGLCVRCHSSNLRADPAPHEGRAPQRR